MQLVIKMKKNDDKKILKSNGSVEGAEYKKLFMIIFIITISFVAIYVVTSIFTKKSDLDDIFENDLNPSEIQYDEVIIGNMFNLGKEYYVLLEDSNDKFLSIYDSYVLNARTNTKIYTVNLSQAFNKKYVSDKNNYDKDDFKVSKTTLVKIKEGKIVSHYEEKDEIFDKLSSLAKKD